MSNHATVAIIGGSFAGLSVLLKLRKRFGKNITIKLFDKREYFCYIPALHETILADKEKLESIQFSLKKYYKNEFIHEGVKTIKKNSLITNAGQEWTFDYAVIATGSRANFFDNFERKKHALAVRYADDIPKINKRLINPKTKSITVIGGGYTGVELAAVITERKRQDQSVRIIHGGNRLFQRLGTKISKLSTKRLEKHDVEVIIGKRVESITKDTISTKDGSIYSSDLTIVSVGIKINNELIDSSLTFDKHYSSNEAKNIFSCGDVAIHGLYTTAHNAMMEGRRVGDLIANDIKGISTLYHPLINRDKLAISLGKYDGIITNGNKGFYLPWFTGFSKRIIEKRVLIEFKWKIMFWI